MQILTTPPTTPTNLFLTRCPLEREFVEIENGISLYVANGFIKDRYKWILDEDVVCTEYVHGLKIAILMEDGTPVQVRTRNTELNLFQHSAIFNAIQRALNSGMITQKNGWCHGVVPGDPHVNISHDWNKLNVTFLPYSKLQKNFRLDQWHNGPKSVDSINKWLHDDLITATRGTNFDPVYPSRVASFRGRNQAKRRPDGLMFFKECITEDGMPFLKTATIQNSCFAWWWLEISSRSVTAATLKINLRNAAAEEERRLRDIKF